jgi:hypothetical protein
MVDDIDLKIILFLLTYIDLDNQVLVYYCYSSIYPIYHQLMNMIYEFLLDLL